MTTTTNLTTTMPVDTPIGRLVLEAEGVGSFGDAWSERD
jgi:hypothetical protein